MKKAIWAVLLLPLLLAACSLATDITPPPGYSAPVLPTAALASYPLVPPDPTQGQAIFNDKCAPCHGTTGMGDGPQAANLANPVAPIGSADLARQAKPVEWYNIVTNGQMAQYMPPFSGSLTDRQRWDVVAYILSLSNPLQLVDEGSAVYTESCAACHGDAGRGDGPQAASAAAKVPDWSDPSRLAQFSAQDIYDATTKGIAPGMPAFSGKLNADQTWAVAAYVRTLSFAGANNAIASAATQPAAGATPTQAGTDQVEAVTAEVTNASTGVPADQATTPSTRNTEVATALPAGEAATPSAGDTAVPLGTTSAMTPQPSLPAANPTPSPVGTVVTGTVNVNGKVTFNAGGSLPSGLSVTLQGYDNMSPVWSEDAPLNADGTFFFAKVPIVAGRVWLAQVVYNKVTFSSQPLHDTDIKSGQDATLDVTISEFTSDASVLVAQRLHVFFDFSVQDTLQVAELFIVQNPSDKAIVPADAKTPSMAFELPQGASGLFFQDGQLGDGRYIQTSTGFGVADSIAPQGTDQVLFAYDIPYPGNKASLSIPINMPVQSAVVLVQSGGVNVSGPQVVAAGTQNVQGSGTYALYTADNLAKGSTLDLTVSGVPASQTGAGAAASSGSSNGLLGVVIGLAVFGAALIGGGFWLVRQRRAQTARAEMMEQPTLPPTRESAESILDAIVALDDLYQAGELPEEAYKERRAELKERLKQLRG
jgi:mono/diheme cytochrome c family protein